MTDAYFERLFVRIVFHWNDGKMMCTECGGDDIRTISNRPHVRCNDCRRWFSAKSEGPFPNSKLPARTLIRLIVAMRREKSARRIALRAGVEYTTAYLFRKRWAEWCKFWVEERAVDNEAKP